jgi:hypothetical protein
MVGGGETTLPSSDRPGDLLERDFTADAPNQRPIREGPFAGD